MKKIKLEIKKVDRRNATEFGDPWGCLVARAAQRQFNNPGVAVGITTLSVPGASIYTFSESNSFRAERALAQPIRDFKPFTITLTPLTPL